MNSNEIRSRFLAFFEKRGHKVIPSASLVPLDDPTVLFNTAGMQPLVPYLLGKPHPDGKRIANSQKCVRTVDIDEVGDATHDTFFEMLGNWSLGDYFKEEAISWSHEFLTSKEEGLGLDPSRLYITCFEGSEDALKDTESADIWMKVGVPKNRIYFLGKDNWWTLGDTSPSGPSTEMHYDVKGGLGDLTHDEFIAASERQDIVEVWNDVFMSYQMTDGKITGELPQKNVDTGAGLERLAIVMQGRGDLFATDLFADIMAILNATAPSGDVRAKRIVADHVRTSVFIIADGVTPSNTDRGYILRRLIRRAVRFADSLGVTSDQLHGAAESVFKTYDGVYDNLAEQREHILQTFTDEEAKFRKSLAKGLREFEKRSAGDISAEDAFELFTTYGFPVEITEELAKEKGISLDRAGFDVLIDKHKQASRTGSAQKFKGGLADHSVMSVKYHTATHLVHQALRDVLGDHVFQKGSNITPKRLRFDFSHDTKMTPEEISQTETIVNAKIEEALPVFYEDIPMAEAQSRGAIGLFIEKYGTNVRVYQIGKGDAEYSLEFCGGPHVENTSELVMHEGRKTRFVITKEEAVASGIRRIKAELVPL